MSYSAELLGVGTAVFCHLCREQNDSLTQSEHSSDKKVGGEAVEKTIHRWAKRDPLGFGSEKEGNCRAAMLEELPYYTRKRIQLELCLPKRVELTSVPPPPAELLSPIPTSKPRRVKPV